jgi:hypothetical protein
MFDDTQEGQSYKEDRDILTGPHAGDVGAHQETVGVTPSTDTIIALGNYEWARDRAVEWTWEAENDCLIDWSEVRGKSIQMEERSGRGDIVVG